MLRVFSWLVAFSCVPGLLFAGELTNIRLASGPLATRIVLDLDRTPSHKLFALSGPDRIVIDLPATAVGPRLDLPEPRGRVKAVRTGIRPGGELRVVLELNEPAQAKSFVLGPEGGFGHRLVVDLSAADTRATPEHKLVDEYTGRDLIIAIDAGHGGVDSGASAHGVHEKDVVLQIARRLADLVERQPGLRPVLIRDSDHKIQLSDRVRLAHEAQADFFISIHADSNKSSKVAGATVYSIDTGRAATEAARRLADRENAADLIGGVRLAEVDDGLAKVLLRLSQDASINKSLLAGQAIIDRLSDVTTILRPRVQQAPLVVLTSPDIPSLLVETAFITNPREAASLRDPTFQQVMAHALLNGILDFFSTSAPRDSYLAHNPPPVDRGPIRHVIARGETLSEIAERYRISLRELRRSNAIDSDVIRIGQVLTIPTTG